MTSLDFSPLKRWFQKEKRSLPWRKNPTPYRVWVSEVMLQQTQVAVVIPYFIRFMERFPTPFSLAQAPLDTVIKMWEGLGYYSRARNLHRGANYLVDHFGGTLPETKDELLKIPGLGPYTVAAILNFAFHKKAAAVDGNVLRVMTRLLEIEEDVAKTKSVNKIRNELEKLLPDEEPWVISEALIELGATICKKRANCTICPLKKTCRANLLSKQELLPVNSKKTNSMKLDRTTFVVTHQDHVLVQRGERGSVMADLHFFPFLEKKIDHMEGALLEAEQLFSAKLTPVTCMSPITHSFTRYQVTLYPYRLSAEETVELEGCFWHPSHLLDLLSFCSGHRQLLKFCGL